MASAPDKPLRPAQDTIRRRFDYASMSRVQVGAVALTVLLSALDGYDVLSVTFAAPAITRDWAIGKGALGVVLSSGLAGMALGSFALAPLADVIGRRRAVLLALALMAIGSLLCATAASVPQLAAWRVVTGLGIGACVAVINPIAAEFANARRRPLALALMATGYPAGGLVGGLLAATLLARFGWPAVFIAGFVVALAILPIVWLVLPESVAFLASRSGPDSLTRLNALLGRCGQPAVSAMPPVLAKGRGYAGVFTPEQLPTTLRLALVNLLAISVIYYVLSWLPQLVADAGFDPSEASLVAATANLVGIVGGVSLGLVARRAGLNRVTVGAIALLGVSLAALGATPASLPLLFVVAGVCGFFVFASSAGFYATLALGFRDEARASGSGFVIGVGRVASALAPLLAGGLFAAGWGRGAVSGLFAAFALVAALVLATHGRQEEQRA